MIHDYDKHRIVLEYLLDMALDNLEMEESDYGLDGNEKDLVEAYVLDNDCDIMNELAETMQDFIREKVEEIVENRVKVFEVEIVKTIRRVLYIKAHDENEIRNEILYADNSDIEFEIEQNGEEDYEIYVLGEYENEKADIDLT